MMGVLSKGQIEDLYQYIKGSNGKYSALQEELLDHLACLVEERLAAGLDYPTAKKQALEYLPKDEVKKTEGRTLYLIHTKPVLMKFFMFFSLSSFLAMAAWFFAAPEPEKPSPAVEIYHSVAAKSEEPPEISPLKTPVKVTSSYGMRMHPVFKKKMLHRGVDFKAPAGTPILATADGMIEVAGEEKNYGLRVTIRHDEQYQSLYAHLSEIKVEVGQQVKKGTVIGLVGSSGKSKAPHLHYEILKDGKAVDPANYLPQS